MINWVDHYDSYKWDQSDQSPLAANEKKAIEEMAIEILGIRAGIPKQYWGVAHPPGRHAHTVIHLSQNLRHLFSQHGATLGLKIFNAGNDCPWMGPKMVTFQTTQRNLLPGLPNAHVQRVFDGGFATTKSNVRHAYLIQEWIEGETLEGKIASGIGVHDLLRVLDDLFLKIIIPLWSKGVVWWDVRDSNYIFTPDKRLIMIDTDILAASVEEMAANSPVYTQRNRHSRTAMARYRAMIGRMAVSNSEAVVFDRKRWNEKRAMELVTLHLFPLFCSPFPLPIGWERQAIRAYSIFREEVTNLSKPSSATKMSTKARKLTQGTLSHEKPDKSVLSVAT